MFTSRTRVRAAVALGAVAITAGLTGCTGAAADDTLTITIWGSAFDKEVFQERLDLAKEALPDINVDLIQISDDYDTKTQTMIAGGEAPDIMMVAEGVNVLSSKGQLEDLSDDLAAAGIDAETTFGVGAVANYSTDEGLWAVPDRSGAMVLYYNKTLFDAAGVAYPDGSWKWEDMRSAAQALTTEDGGEKTWGYAAGDWWAWYLTWMEQNGGAILDDNGNPVANSDENVEALEFYNDLVLKDQSAPSPIDYADAGLSNGQPDPLFAQGRLAMETTGFWNIATLKETDLDWGIAPIWSGTEAAVPAFGSGLAVSSQSQHKEEAAELVAFLTSAAGQTPIADSGIDVPANLEVVASDAFQNPAWNTTGVDLSAFTNSADDVYSPPLTPEWNQITKAFTDGLDATWKGEKSVREGLDAVQDQLESILK